jgi:hypothetical protein
MRIIRSETEALRNKIESLEDYERHGGGGAMDSRESWDAFVERHREISLLLRDSLRLLDQANNIPRN